MSDVLAIESENLVSPIGLGECFLDVSHSKGYNWSPHECCRGTASKNCALLVGYSADVDPLGGCPRIETSNFMPHYIVYQSNIEPSILWVKNHFLYSRTGS